VKLIAGCIREVRAVSRAVAMLLLAYILLLRPGG
jgi:hypothetical protein